MPTTSVYGLPYQGVTDAPNGPVLGQQLAEAVEAQIVRLDQLLYTQRQTLIGTQASVTFSAIPTALRSLSIRWTARGDDAATFVHMRMRVNADTGANYNAESTQGLAGAASAFAQLAQAYAFAGHATAAGATANMYGSGEIVIVGWDSPHTSFLGYNFTAQAMTSGGLVNLGGGTYNIAGPYTSLTVFPGAGSWVAGSDFQLTGWRT